VQDYFVKPGPGTNVGPVTVHPVEAAKQGGRKSTQKVEKYISRIPLAWHERVCTKCTHAVPVGNLIWYRRWLTKSTTITLPAQLLRDHGISKHRKLRAIAALEKAGLITVLRVVGRNTRITVISP
jgi:hypothetical protein